MRADDDQVGGDHYKQMLVTPWDVMQLVLTPEEWRGYLKGCIIKYTMRNGLKPGADDDQEKAAHCKRTLDEVNRGS